MKVIYTTQSDRIKNLTLGQEYEIISEQEDTFNILNNKQVEARYFKKLFTEVPTEPVFTLSPVVLTTKSPSPSNYIESELRRDGSALSVLGNVLFPSGISCGVGAMDGLSSNIETLLTYLPRTMVAEFMANHLEDVLAYDSHALLVTSPNSQYYPILERVVEILNEREPGTAIMTPWVINENSGNPICTLILRGPSITTVEDVSAYQSNYDSDFEEYNEEED